MKKERDNHRTVALRHMTLERLVFDLFEYPFLVTRATLHDDNNAVTKGCVMGKTSICPYVTDIFLMHRVVEQ